MTPVQFTTIREQLNLSQSELAVVLGISHRAVSLIEAGQTQKVMRSTQIVMCAMRDGILTIEQVRDMK
jgi:transcriptional regulator with XRE-family HTH domain